MKYKRASEIATAEFCYPFNICLNGLEKISKQKLSSLQLFMDLHFASDLNLLADRLSHNAEISFSKQWVKTFITNSKGDQGSIEYLLSPSVVFEMQNDICKLHVQKMTLNMSEVKVMDLPFGPNWLPHAVNDKIATLGFNLIKLIDDLGIVTNTVTPFMNAWLDQNRALMGCDKTKQSSLTFFYDLASNKSSMLWTPARAFVAPLTPILHAPTSLEE